MAHRNQSNRSDPEMRDSANPATDASSDDERSRTLARLQKAPFSLDFLAATKRPWFVDTRSTCYKNVRRNWNGGALALPRRISETRSAHRLSGRQSDAPAKAFATRRYLMSFLGSVEQDASAAARAAGQTKGHRPVAHGCGAQAVCPDYGREYVLGDHWLISGEHCFRRTTVFGHHGQHENLSGTRGPSACP